MALPGNRNTVGPAAVVAYLLGVVCTLTGIYLATVTRLYFFTGQMTHPYLIVGIALAVTGIVTLVAAQLAAKRRLTK